MKHYVRMKLNGDNSWKSEEENEWVYEYIELNENQWFDGGTRVDGKGTWKCGEEPKLIHVIASYWSRDVGRYGWRGRYFEPAGDYFIAKEDKKELHRLIKIWYPNCEFRYRYY